MAHRMTGVTFTPSSTQTDAMWAAARAKRALMLRNSDWTQLRDVYHTLSPETRTQWDIWRRTVRSIKAQQFTTPEEFSSALDNLHAHAPPGTTVDTVVDGPILVPADAADKAPISTPPPDLRQIVVESASIILAKCAANLGINTTTIGERVAEAADAQVEFLTEGQVDGTRYPICASIANALDTTVEEVAARTMTTYTRWIGVIATIESTMQRVLVELDSAEEKGDQAVQDVIDAYETSMRKILATTK